MSLDAVFAEIQRVHKEYGKLPKRYLAVDTETTGRRLFHGDKPFAVSTCDQTGHVNLWRCKVDPATRQPKWSRTQLAEIKAYLETFPILVFHNLKFDIRALKTIGIDVLEMFGWSNIRCTLLYSHVLDSQEDHGLKEQAHKYLDYPKDDEEELQKEVTAIRRSLRKKGIDLRGETKSDYWLAGESCNRYAKGDAIRTACLLPMQIEALKIEERERAKIKRDGWLKEVGPTWNVAREHLLVPTLYQAEELGLTFNRKLAAEKRRKFAELGNRHIETAKAIAVRAGMPKDFNQGSSKQLTALLYGKWNLPVLKLTKKSQNPSTDADTLELLSTSSRDKKHVEFFSHLLDGRGYLTGAAYLDEYLESAIESACKRYALIHSSLNQTGTATTRLSSSDPNAQNVSTDEEMSLREVFGPRPGYYWINPDYDNLEMRILAYISKEKKLIEMFKRGDSYHAIVANLLFGPKEKWKGYNKNDWKKSLEYKRTKNGNFARNYNAGQARVDATYGVPGAYDRLRNEYSNWTAYNEKMVEEGETNGFIDTLFGYRLVINKHRAYTTSLNYKIQGSAGCAMKYAMLSFAKSAKLEKHPGKIVLTVHDELITEWPNSFPVKRAAQLTKQAMESPGELIKIPLPVKPILIRKKWTEGVPVELD